MRGWMLVVTLAFASLPSCKPGHDIPDDPEGRLPDLSPPAQSCTQGATRCSADQSAVESCGDGTNWVRSECDVAAGQRCAGARCALPCEGLPAGNVGCTFYPLNLWSTSEVGQLGIVATNTSDRLTARITLSDDRGILEKGEAKPGGVVIFRLDHNKNKLSRTEQSKKGMVLTSTAPVAAYLFHPIDAAQVFSGSATLLLPEHVLGRNYFVVSYTYNEQLMTTPPQGQGLLAVVALSDNTDIEVTVPVDTTLVAAGGTLRKRLSRLEVLELIQVNSLDDISGAVVKSSAPVAVYGGAGGVSIPRTAIGGNHLGVQMFPLSTWGKRYVAAKVKQRNATDHDYYRVLASVDNTHVTLSGAGLPKVPVLRRGEIFEFETDIDFEISADQPIMAFQYMPAWGNLTGDYDPAEFPDGVSPRCPFNRRGESVRCLGDANITPLIPVEQYRNDYIFYVPATYTYDYIQVTAPIGTKLTLDGALVSEVLRPVSGTNLGRAIIRMRNPDMQNGNYHRVSGSESFGLLGYGYSYATSYSYAGGLNLEKINPVE